MTNRAPAADPRQGRLTAPLALDAAGQSPERSCYKGGLDAASLDYLWTCVSQHGCWLVMMMAGVAAEANRALCVHGYMTWLAVSQ